MSQGLSKCKRHNFRVRLVQHFTGHQASFFGWKFIVRASLTRVLVSSSPRGDSYSRLGRSYYSSLAIARDASFFHIKK